jgi:DNA replication protein DnaC
MLVRSPGRVRLVARFPLGVGATASSTAACQRQAEENRRERAMQQNLAAARAAAQDAQIYGWFGAAWPQQGLRDLTFATFDETMQPEAYERARAFAASPRGTLWLVGGYGVGKTHLLAAIANVRRERGEVALFASAVTLFDAIQDRIGHKQDYHDLLKRAIATPLFLLDDVDKPKPSDFREEVYYQVIDGRTRVGRPIALTCNCSPVALVRWIGGAARSRLMQAAILIEMVGQDYRLLHQPQGERRLDHATPVPHAAHPDAPASGANDDEPEEDDDA